MTDRNKVRLLIGDPEGATQHFSNDEIDAFLEMASNSVLLAASYALESWAASLADSVNSEHIGDYSYQKKTAENKMALAKKYREENASAPAMDWASLDLLGVTEEADE